MQSGVVGYDLSVVEEEDEGQPGARGLSSLEPGRQPVKTHLTSLRTLAFICTLACRGNPTTGAQPTAELVPIPHGGHRCRSGRFGKVHQGYRQFQDCEQQV